MAYNLNVFEVFVVSIPETRRLLALVAVASAIGGVLVAAALLAAPVATGPTVALAVAAGVFAGPTLVGGEAIHRLVPAYPRNWGLYLALVSQLLVVVVLPIVLALGGGWDLLWVAFGAAFLNAFEVLVVSDGLDRFPLLGVASAVQPGLMAIGFTLAVPALSRPLVAHAPAVAVVVAVGVGLGLASAFVEWLLDANVTEVGGLEITSNLVQRTPLDLGMGFPVEPRVQTLALDTGAGTARVVAPWVHPGVLEGIGGGRLTRESIRTLNDDGNNDDTDDDDRDGFFLHVPCSHLSDAAEPTVPEAVAAGVTTPSTGERASRLLTETYDGTTFHGRRYGDARIVYVESDHYGDYELDVFADVVDLERTLLVDRHVRADERDREFVFADSPAVPELRAQLRDFLDTLDDEPLGRYYAGHAVDLELEGSDISLFALVERVDDQRTLLLGADQNENPEPLVELRERLADEYDEIVLFTTDTHASVYGERFDPQVSTDRAREVVERAAETVAPASAGLGLDRGDETRLLRTDYLRLLHSLNAMARVYILLLAALYVCLVAGLVAVSLA